MAAARIEMLGLSARVSRSAGSHGLAAQAIQRRHEEAFDPAAVTAEFLREYTGVFDLVERAVQGVVDEGRRPFTQRLFNRLMFIRFFHGPGAGLFEQDERDADPAIVVPDEAIDAIVQRLFARFHFTVTESTSADAEVAVDPEMLGRVFEELVAGRHEAGCYYTPKPIVSFMAREALKNYLHGRLPAGRAEALAAFVDDHEARRLKEPEKVLDALRSVTVCDPACGSGAYLIGMMHELFELRAALCRDHRLDPLTPYQRKLQIIRTNLYGVDIDPAAVNIARQRLWLSLAADFKGDAPPPSLPKLDYRIVVGDSLAAPDPSQRLRPGMAKASSRSLYGPPGAVGGFDWPVAFPEVFAGGGFDVVVANPPYGLLNKRQNQKMGHAVSEQVLAAIRASAEYGPVLRGMVNVCTLFIRRSMSLLRPGGTFVEIFPLSFAGDLSFAGLRKHLLESHRLRRVEAFPERDNPRRRVFAGAKTSACIVVAERGGAGDEPFSLRLHSGPTVDAAATVTRMRPSDLERLNSARAIPLVSQEELDELKRIYGRSARLSEIGRCYTGEIDLTLCRPYIRAESSFSILYKGAIIDRYRLRPAMSQGRIEYLDERAYLAAKGTASASAFHHRAPRIVLQGITGVNERIRLKMTLAPAGVFCANSTNYILLKNPDEGEYLFVLAVLNSAVANRVFKCFSTNSNVNGYQVDGLPIPPASPSDKAAIAALAKACVVRNGADCEDLEDEIERRAAGLYGVRGDLPHRKRLGRRGQRAATVRERRARFGV